GQPREPLLRHPRGRSPRRSGSSVDEEVWMSPVLQALALLFGVGLAGGLAFTPAARAAARRIGLLDCPDGRRKGHGLARPIAGGIAVFAAAVLAVIAFGA